MDGPDPRFAQNRYIQTFPATWDVIMINVGLAQARPKQSMLISEISIQNLEICV